MNKKELEKDKILYIEFNDHNIDNTVEVNVDGGTINIDFDINSEWVGLEILNYNKLTIGQNADSLQSLITSSITEYLQDKLNDYDVGSLEYKIIKGWLNE